MPTPWQPPGFLRYGPGVALTTEGGIIQEEHVVWSPCYRVIASEYAGENLFDRLTSDADYAVLEAEVEALREIADLTNAHVQSEAGRFDLVRPEDRIYGDGAGLIMVSFAFPGPPSRFSDGSSGTYYAARALATAIAETRYHEEITLRDSEPCVTEKTVIHADLDATLVDLRRGCTVPAGIYDPVDYSAGQGFGGGVRYLEGYGIVFDSVRHPGGECVAIFRPPALSRARAVQTLRYHWDGSRIVDVR